MQSNYLLVKQVFVQTVHYYIQNMTKTLSLNGPTFTKIEIEITLPLLGSLRSVCYFIKIKYCIIH